MSSERHFKKITEMLGFDCEYTVVDPKIKFWSFSVKNSKRSAVEPSIEKAILLIFVILFPTFCPRMFQEADWCF